MTMTYYTCVLTLYTPLTLESLFPYIPQSKIIGFWVTQDIICVFRLFDVTTLSYSGTSNQITDNAVTVKLYGDNI